MITESEFLRPDRVNSVYGALSMRVSSKDPLGEIPYVRDGVSPRPITREEDPDKFIDLIISEEFSDFIKRLI
jgi:hypothetical protein